MTEHAESRFRFALRELRAYLARKVEDDSAADHRRARVAMATVNRYLRGGSDEDSQKTPIRASGRKAR